MNANKTFAMIVQSSIIHQVIRPPISILQLYLLGIIARNYVTLLTVHVNSAAKEMRHHQTHVHVAWKVWLCIC